MFQRCSIIGGTAAASARILPPIHGGSAITPTIWAIIARRRHLILQTGKYPVVERVGEVVGTTLKRPSSPRPGPRPAVHCLGAPQQFAGRPSP